jgi:hypothetical protein
MAFRPDGCVLERNGVDVETQRLRGLSRRLGGGLFFTFQQWIEIAGAVGVLNHAHDGRGDGDFVHLDVATDDAPEIVTSADFFSRQQGFRAGGLDLELAQDDLRERADGSVADRDFGVHRFGDPRQDDSLEERRTGGDEVNDDDQDHESTGNPGQFAEPAPAFWWLSRCCNCVCHNFQTCSRTVFIRLNFRSILPIEQGSC